MSDLPNPNQPKSAGLTKQNLAVVGSSIGGKYVVTVGQTVDGLWTVAVKFDGKEEVHLETVRGSKKIWRNIGSAISFVQENCSLASEVIVKVGGWTLSRVDGNARPSGMNGVHE